MTKRSAHMIRYIILLMVTASLLPACSKKEPEKMVTPHGTVYPEDPTPMKPELSAISGRGKIRRI